MSLPGLCEPPVRGTTNRCRSRPREKSVSSGCPAAVQRRSCLCTVQPPRPTAPHRQERRQTPRRSSVVFPTRGTARKRAGSPASSPAGYGSALGTKATGPGAGGQGPLQERGESPQGGAEPGVIGQVPAQHGHGDPVASSLPEGQPRHLCPTAAGSGAHGTPCSSVPSSVKWGDAVLSSRAAVG